MSQSPVWGPEEELARIPSYERRSFEREPCRSVSNLDSGRSGGRSEASRATLSNKYRLLSSSLRPRAVAFMLLNHSFLPRLL